ncbi:MAG: S-methyl-5-thioribose-1-phosphate isomerase [Desulfobacteraceae bacterium]|nr:MAG: S-methyl-5-thioribose-1-phosphate isomerase [Desulfobacteraceae bacterium]
MIPTVEWQNNHVRMIDQRKLPGKREWYICKGYKDVIRAIETMVIRGAPAIGVAAAMGLALGGLSIRTSSYDTFRARFREMAAAMIKARPTAVNLRWAVERMSGLVDRMAGTAVAEIRQALRQESQRVLEEDIEINRRMGRNGQKLVPKNASILTHCNAGALATGGYGTALGVIRAAVEAGKKVRVIADETRPWLQGLRLTCFELMEDDIPVTVIADNAAGSLMRRKEIDLVVTGADRIAANGDTANKIGTYQVAVLARENNIPFYVAAPLSTIDMSLPSGDRIPIEERSGEEICRIKGNMFGPKGVSVCNPVFDVTPARYITAIITEAGVIRPPYKKELQKVFSKIK